MPLSENEQRQLEAIERALAADDPKFANTVRSSDLRRYHRRRLVRSAALFAVGLVLLVCTIINPLFGLAGFVLMFVAALTAASALKRLNGPADPRFGRSNPGGPSRGPAAPQIGWRDRIEERFKRRFDDRD